MAISKIKLIHIQPCPKCAHLGIIGAMLSNIGAIAHCIAQTSERVMPRISEMDLDFLISVLFISYLVYRIIGFVTDIYKQSNNKYKTLLQNQFDQSFLLK